MRGVQVGLFATRNFALNAIQQFDKAGRIEEPIFPALRFMLGVAVGGGLGFDASVAPWFFLACGSGGVDAFEI